MKPWPVHFTPPISGLEKLRPPVHLCSIYESQQEHLALAISFIRIGLDRGEKCIYMGDDGTPAGIGEALQTAGIDADRAVASRSLVWTTHEQVYS